MKNGIITILLIVGISFGSLNATTIYVDGKSRSNGKGTLKSPYKKIQTAIVNAKNGDTVIVAASTYNEAIDFLGKAITVQSSAGKQATIIDGTNLGQVSVVTFKTNESASSILQGFTIRNGEGSVQMINGNQFLIGGGILCVNASPTISDVDLTGNRAGHGGGIGGIINSSPTLTNVSFINNQVTVNGGGAMFMIDCTPSFQYCTFQYNTAVHTGGAINVRDSILTISNCIFDTNNGGLMGGGVRVGALSSADVSFSQFHMNVAKFGGGLAAGSDTQGITGTVTITNCIFDTNSSPNGNQLSINGLFPAYMNISNSYVAGGDTQESIYVNPDWDRATYLNYVPDMRITAPYNLAEIEK